MSRRRKNLKKHTRGTLTITGISENKVLQNGTFTNIISSDGTSIPQYNLDVLERTKHVIERIAQNAPGGLLEDTVYLRFSGLVELFPFKLCGNSLTATNTTEDWQIFECGRDLGEPGSVEMASLEICKAIVSSIGHNIAEPLRSEILAADSTDAILNILPVVQTTGIPVAPSTESVTTDSITTSGLSSTADSTSQTTDTTDFFPTSGLSSTAESTSQTSDAITTNKFTTLFLGTTSMLASTAPFAITSKNEQQHDSNSWQIAFWSLLSVVICIWLSATVACCALLGSYIYKNRRSDLRNYIFGQTETPAENPAAAVEMQNTELPNTDHQEEQVLRFSKWSELNLK